VQLLDRLGWAALEPNPDAQLLDLAMLVASCSRTGAMNLGLIIGYWNTAGPPPGVAESIAEAEKLGFDSMWTAEAYGSDAFTPLAWGGGGPSCIRLGTSLCQICGAP